MLETCSLISAKSPLLTPQENSLMLIALLNAAHAQTAAHAHVVVAVVQVNPLEIKPLLQLKP